MRAKRGGIGFETVAGMGAIVETLFYSRTPMRRILKGRHRETVSSTQANHF